MLVGVGVNIRGNLPRQPCPRSSESRQDLCWPGLATEESDTSSATTLSFVSCQQPLHPKNGTSIYSHWTVMRLNEELVHASLGHLCMNISSLLSISVSFPGLNASEMGAREREIQPWMIGWERLQSLPSPRLHYALDFGGNGHHFCRRLLIASY